MNRRKLNCVVCNEELVTGINWRATQIARKCTECLAKYSKEWYETNKERIQQQAYTFRRANPALVMYQRVKTRAKRLNLPFNLELSDIVIPEVCPVFGLPFVIGKASPQNPSLDRIIPNLGYTKGNIIVISKRANTIKSDATSEELQLVAEFCEKVGCVSY